MKKIFTLFAVLACVMSMLAADIPAGTKLYLTPNANWNQSNARFAAYFFGNGDAWVSMTKVVGENNLYEVTSPSGSFTNVIFCRMNPSASANNWDNKWNQTADLTYDGKKNHYTVKENTWDKGGGTWSIWPIPEVITYADVTITVTANAAAAIIWKNGGDKLADATDYVAMTAGENNTYSYTLAQVDEAKGVTYTIKVGDVVSIEQNTDKSVTIDFKDLLPQVAVMGVNNWDGTDRMTISDDYLSAYITLPLTAKDYEWKITVNGEWFGGGKYAITRDKNTLVVTDNVDGNGKLTADLTGDYVFTWTYATKTLVVTYPATGSVPDPGTDPKPETGVAYNVTVPAGTNACYIAGEMNGWSHTEMTKVDDTHYTLTIETATTSMKYKYCSGPSWTYVEKTAAGEEVADRVYSANDVVEAWAAVYDPTSTPIDPAQITYVLMGVAGDWTTGIAMTKNESSEWEEYMLIGQTIAEGDSVKVVRLENGTAKHWCGNVKEGVTVTITPDDKNGNIILTPGAYDFYYDVAADAIWIAEATQSVIGNIAVEKKAIKIVRNGQLYILREGVMYNIFGQIAE